jgi:molybdopterin synthase catalytic subunit
MAKPAPLIAVQTDDFDMSDCYQALVADNCEDGAVVTFVGRVREFNQGHNVADMLLEHYPGMTEKALHELAQQAQSSFAIHRVSVIHRVGHLRLCDQIVFVGVSAAHRKDAFAACMWLMDELKSRAPFWKKETTTTGMRWVSAETMTQSSRPEQ